MRAMEGWLRIWMFHMCSAPGLRSDRCPCHETRGNRESRRPTRGTPLGQLLGKLGQIRERNRFVTNAGLSWSARTGDPGKWPCPKSARDDRSRRYSCIDMIGPLHHDAFVPTKTAKTEQLQIRVTKKQKADIRAWAQADGMDVSAWVLNQLLSAKRAQFSDLVSGLEGLGKSSHAFAALSDFLAGLSRSEFTRVLDVPPPNGDHALPPQTSNYLAAMVEHTATQKQTRPPRWTSQVPAIAEPYFGTRIPELRFLLLRESPVAFRRRNIFVDSTVGDRV